VRFNRLDLNQLVCLDALFEERNVTRAGERVFLSQSAMSCSLARLREYFKDDLFVPVGRAMALTPLAQNLAKPVRDLLLQVQAITSAKPAFEPLHYEGKVKVLASDYIAAVFLPEVIRRASREAPGMRFDIRQMNVRHDKELDSGEVDLAVIPSALAASDHPNEELFSDFFSCLVCKDNEQFRDGLSLPQYLAAGHVTTEWGAGRLVTLDEYFAKNAGHARRIEVVAPTFTLVPLLVIGTRRVATLMTRLAEQMAERWPVRVLPSPLAFPPFTEVVQWHKYRNHDPALIWLRGILHSVAASLPLQQTSPCLPSFRLTRKMTKGPPTRGRAHPTKRRKHHSLRATLK
jgi:LysR family transcriptional regulator, nod-box dependent transcriptional activator